MNFKNSLKTTAKSSLGGISNQRSHLLTLKKFLFLPFVDVEGFLPRFFYQRPSSLNVGPAQHLFSGMSEQRCF